MYIDLLSKDDRAIYDAWNKRNIVPSYVETILNCLPAILMINFVNNNMKEIVRYHSWLGSSENMGERSKRCLTHSTNVPMITFASAEEKDEFLVYTKIMLPQFYSPVQTISAFTDPDFWVRQAKQFANLGDDKDAIERAFLITEKSGIGRILMRKYDALNGELNKDELNRLSQLVAGQLLPLELFEARTNKEWMDMYHPSMDSCMVWRPGRAWDFLNPAEFHPTNFYAACSDFIYGLYAKLKDGKIMARTIVYDGKTFGRVYAGSTGARTKFIRALYARGLRGINDNTKSSAEELARDPTDKGGSYLKHHDVWIRTVKGKTLDGEHHFIPLPYFDNIARVYYQTYEKRDDGHTYVKLSINGNSGKFSLGTRDQRGFYNASHLIDGAVNCASCGRVCSVSTEFNTPRGSVCGAVCAAKLGFVRYYTGAGEASAWGQAHELYKEPMTDTYYTNISVFRKLRPEALPILDFNSYDPVEIKEEDDELQYSTSPYKLELGNSMYAISSAAFNQLVNLKLAKPLGNNKLLGQFNQFACEIQKQDPIVFETGYETKTDALYSYLS